MYVVVNIMDLIGLAILGILLNLVNGVKGGGKDD